MAAIYLWTPVYNTWGLVNVVMILIVYHLNGPPIEKVENICDIGVHIH